MVVKCQFLALYTTIIKSNNVRNIYKSCQMSVSGLKLANKRLNKKVEDLIEYLLKSL